jgi:hypothetical protein
MNISIKQILMTGCLAALPFTAGELRADHHEKHGKQDRAAHGTAAAQDRALIREVQENLKDKGHYKGEIDGIMGPQTREALRQYQRDENIQVTGALDARTKERLGVRAEAREAAGTAEGAVRGAAADAERETRQAGREAEGAARQAGRQTEGATREAGREVKGAAGEVKGAGEEVREAGREAGRLAGEGAAATERGARGAARKTEESAREAGREVEKAGEEVDEAGNALTEAGRELRKAGREVRGAITGTDEEKTEAEKKDERRSRQK